MDRKRCVEKEDEVCRCVVQVCGAGVWYRCGVVWCGVLSGVSIYQLKKGELYSGEALATPLQM